MIYYNKAMKRLLVIFSVLMLIPVTEIKAQDNDNLDKLTSFKIAFFTQKLNLTPSEAEKFWPVYNDYSARKGKIQAERFSLIRYASQNEANMNEAELALSASKLTQTFVDEANLTAYYGSEIQKILPPAKVIRLYQAENQYKQRLLMELKERRQQGPRSE